MTYNANILLGRIAKVYGFEGAVTVKLEKAFIENIPDTESVFLEIEGKPVPFFIEWSEYSGGDTIKIKFLWYDTASRVSEFKGCRILLEGDADSEFSDDLNIFRDFKILLSDKTAVGRIVEIFDNPGNPLLKVVNENKREILIPLHQDFILKVDRKNKIIIMNLPEGLLDLTE
jgi:16S rRNA processing protein RimM